MKKYQTQNIFFNKKFRVSAFFKRVVVVSFIFSIHFFHKSVEGKKKTQTFKGYRSKRLQFLRVMSHYVSFVTNAKNIWDHCTSEQFNPGNLQCTELSTQGEFRRLFPFKSHFSHGGAKIWLIIFSYKVLYVPIIRVWNPFCK